MTTPLTSLFVSSPNLQTYLNDKATGLPLSAGTVTFYSDINRNTLKPVYQITGSPPNYSVAAIPNPNTINSDGTLSDGVGGRIIPLFYPFDADGNPEQYYITVYNSDSVLQETLENWPPNEATSSSVVPSNTEPVNFIKNAQFLIWDHEPVIYPNGKTIITTYVTANADEQVVDGWFINKNNGSTIIDSISQQSFTAAQTEVEGNPRYYIEYKCTSNGGGETTKRLIQIFFKNAQFLQGETHVFSIAARADQVRGLTVSWGQNFGTGGSPSPQVITPLYTTNLSPAWNKYTTLVTIPSTTGKILGTNYNDYCFITLDLDLNTTCTYDFCNILLQPGNSLNFIFPEEPYAKQKSRLDPFWLVPTGQTLFNYFGNIGALDQAFWIPWVDQSIGNSNSTATYAGLAYLNLFVLIWNTCVDAQAPVSGGRGADAVSDWNASKKLQIPPFMSRLAGNSGSGGGLSVRAPGQVGGAETQLYNHSHTFGTDKNVASANAAWEGVSLTTAGADLAVAHNGFGAALVTNLTATDVTGNAGDTMPPYTFHPAYIHI